MLQDNSHKNKVEEVLININKLTDFLIESSVSSPTLEEGQTVDLQIKVSNNGPAFVNSGNVQFDVSDSFRVLNIRSTNGTVVDNNWSFKNIAKGEHALLTVSATVKSFTASKVAGLKVTSSSIDKKDINASDDILKSQILIDKNVDLSVRAQTQFTQDQTSDVVTYVYEIQNQGPAVATNIEMLIILDLKNFKPEIYDYSRNSNLEGKRWKIQSILPNESARLTVQGRILDPAKKLEKLNFKILRLDQTDSNQSPDVIIDLLGDRNESLQKVTE
jgi:hypothetical protein